MAGKLTQNKQILEGKIPEIEKTLATVKHIQSKKDSEEGISTHFELADHLYANATIKHPKSVCLWLGANVMVEFSFEEALDLLTKNLTSANENLDSLTKDVEFLREQITTSEVNMARIYNYDVKQRRIAKQRQQSQ
eukprot:TRINITY_DN2667_c0_g1_i2.p1 TRINITY_DN2667_c0_g1~~TRINITY_DN2667_c0_g1_i2.p1  ORF type:complete len:136 (+),score=25.68 TRINITY_DN2667_c0_g1_i2:259-666(+)